MRTVPIHLQKYVLLLVSFMFYGFTLAPTLVAGDSAALSMRAHHLELHFGRASDHPLYTLIGNLFSRLPFELAFSLNLMSAVFGTLTVWLIFLIVKHLTLSDASAWFGALSLMVSHAFWMHSVIAEVYTLNAFFLALLVYLTLTQINSRLFKYCFPLVFLLGLFNHLILALSLPAFWIYTLLNADKTHRKFYLTFTALVCLAAIGTLIWLAIFRTDLMKSIIYGPPPIIVYLTPPSDFHLLVKEMGMYVLYLWYQYPLFGVIIGLVGVVNCFRQNRSVAVFLILIIALNGLFFMKTTGWKSYGGTKYTFYISDYTIFAVFVGCGFSSLVDQMKKLMIQLDIQINARIRQRLPSIMIAASVILTIGFYALMPAIVESLKMDLVHARSLPYRDNNRFFLNPNKRGYEGDRNFGEEVLQIAGKNAVIFADFTPYTILEYLKDIEASRPDITLLICTEKTDMHIQLDEIKENNPHSQVYLADDDYCNFDRTEEKYIMKRRSPFFEIEVK